MQLHELSDYDEINPRGYAVYRDSRFPQLYEIKDKDGKRLNTNKYTDKLKAEGVLIAYLTTAVETRKKYIKKETVFEDTQ
jgi:hypothetical protein